MNLQEFSELTANKIIYVDGATGSNLIKRGMPAGVCPEKWILENPNVMIELQQEYVAAGTNILYAPTFTSNRVKLAEYGMENDLIRINKQLVALSRKAAAGKAFVAGDITMTGRQLAPMGNMGFEELISIYKEQIQALVMAEVDLLVVETMMSLQETRAALIAAKEVCQLPVMCSLTFEQDGRTLYGTDAVTAAVTLEKLGACAIGANCSTGPDKMKTLIKEIAQVVSIPVIAKPNAGIPCLNEQGETVYSMDAKAFAREMKEMVNAGAGILGGCCGTTPEHIKKLVEATKNLEKKPLLQSGIRYLSSERKTVKFDLDSPFMIVGERINPTGKKKLQEQLRQGNLDMVLSFTEEQEECGAALLDVNVGMSGIDEKELMLQVLDEVTVNSSLPLALDSSHVEVLEAALRKYPGRALINSISGEKDKLEKLLPLAKKYGAMFILLPLSDKGLPETLEEKIEIIQHISEKAFALGMSKEDIVVDGLVTTVGANPVAARQVLETISYCKANGYATICGLSNISFGLPERSFVNTAFLTMAIKEGLSMAIANPSQDLLVNIAFASDLLMSKEESDLRYIERMEWASQRRPQTDEKLIKPKPAEADTAKENIIADDKSQNQIYLDVLKGNGKQIVEHTGQAIANGMNPDTILNDYLMPAMDEVGLRFEKKKYFLPQLIASAEAMKASVEYLEPLMICEQEKETMPTVVIATVAGDIHDIGKNLVSLMLKNHGFQVIDLGKDVPKETIVKTAKEHDAKIVALSALMTTTMQEMKNVINEAKEKELSAKIMIGGAVITQDYADEIGADGYSANAAQAVHTAQKLIGKE